MRAWRAQGAPQVVSRVRAWRSRAPSWLLLTISPREGLGLTTLTRPPITCSEGFNTQRIDKRVQIAHEGIHTHTQATTLALTELIN